MDDRLPVRAGLRPDRAPQRTASGPLPPRLLASWQRSQDYGVPLEEVEPVFTGTWDEQSLFFQCGREVLTDLHRTLVDQPVSLMLTDAEGLVLNRLSGDAALLRALDAVHLAPGFGYAERHAGTNGVGLALADRTPTVVRADQHYSLNLCSYTCAAVPVLDPVTGRLEGSVNITTWADSPSELLLALAQSAAGTTSALMLARSGGGQQPRTPLRTGHVFRVESPRLEPGSGTDDGLSAAWQEPLSRAAAAMRTGGVVLAVGGRGSGRTTLLAQAERRTRPAGRILAATVPPARDVDTWLSVWTPEVGKPCTAIVLRGVDGLPVWAAERLRELFRSAGAGRGDSALPLSMTAERFDDVPASLAQLVDTVVQVPPLSDRPDDVLPLVHALARRVRGRPVAFTARVERVLRDHSWPGGVTELEQVVREAAGRADLVDVQHLPRELLTSGGRRLSRLEALERDELVRVLVRPGVRMQDAAAELGLSRATIYRKIAQYGIAVPRR